MRTHLRPKARRIAIAVALSLVIAGPSTVALAATGENDSGATGEAASNASTVATQPSNWTAESKAVPAPKAETSSAELEN